MHPQIMSLSGPQQSRVNYRKGGNVLIAGGNVDDPAQMMEKRRARESSSNVQSSCRWISRFVGLLRVWA